MSGFLTVAFAAFAAAAPNPLNSPCLLVNPLCAASGFNIDYYANIFGGGYSNSLGGVQSNYYLVDNLQPLDSALTNTTFFPQDYSTPGTAIYPNATLQSIDGPFPYFEGYTRETNGGIVVDGNNFTLVYSGLFKAPTTGAWQICTSADNENDVYFGDGNAFSCLTGKPDTEADPILTTIGGGFNDPNSCTTVTLIEGLYYPVRSVMGNYGQESGFNLTFVPPGVEESCGENKFTGQAYPWKCAISLDSLPSLP